MTSNDLAEIRRRWNVSPFTYPYHFFSQDEVKSKELSELNRQIQCLNELIKDIPALLSALESSQQENEILRDAILHSMGCDLCHNCLAHVRQALAKVGESKKLLGEKVP